MCGMVEMMEYLTILTRSVGTAVGDHSSDTAPWVRHIPVIAGDEVQMDMEDGLAGGSACIDPDVESIRLVTLPDDILCLIQEFHTRELEIRSQFKIIRHMLFWDHQDVTRIDRKGIKEGNGMFVFH